jgi:purine-nucleoside phosphorylase
MTPGQLAIITDHINFQGTSPLLGPRGRGNDFPDMGQAYSPAIREVLAEAARSVDVVLHEGVYAACLGPAYETPAEVRMLARLGADLVGMSTVPEILAAAELGLPAAALAVVTNRAAGLANETLAHEDVTLLAGQVAPRLAAVIEATCAGLDR